MISCFSKEREREVSRAQQLVSLEKLIIMLQFIVFPIFYHPFLSIRLREAIPKKSHKAADYFRTPLREAVKYYFADFVRKWGTKNFSSKRAKNCVFCSKNT